MNLQAQIQPKEAFLKEIFNNVLWLVGKTRVTFSTNEKQH